ncbi:MAG TPA: GNAT family N-acetyltransferase [Chitinophagaceae bacterium]|nr:GNAT family N-acetyltransferase [Chitinophagaceae bacterium]
MSSLDHPTILVRTAGEKDAEIIADLSQQTFIESFAAYNTKENMEMFMNFQFTRQKLIDEVRQPWHTFYLAFINNEPVGYVKMREGEVPETLVKQSSIEIARIYSVHHMIGKGVGKILMQTCHDLAMQKKKDILWLGVWEKNQRAIDFYAHWGFERFGEQNFILGADVQTDWLMKKVLH